MVGAVFIGVILLIAAISLFFVVPQIIGGYKLWKEKPNARTWGIVGSIISCLSFPIGTAAGVYGLWFLFGFKFEVDCYFPHELSSILIVRARFYFYKIASSEIVYTDNCIRLDDHIGRGYYFCRNSLWQEELVGYEI